MPATLPWDSKEGLSIGRLNNIRFVRYEVKQALEQVEKNLRLAFELDPGNYTAYDVYFFFLTNEVTQTEFASIAGAQLKDDDDDDPANGGGDTQKPDDPRWEYCRSAA